MPPARVELSVVLATLGRPAWAAAVVRDVLAQADDTVEIVVVDQSSAHARRVLKAAVSGDPRVRVVDAEPRGLPSARNRGLAEAQGRLIWFLDDDVRLLPGALQAHLDAYTDPGVGGAVGRLFETRVAANVSTTRNALDWGGRVRTRLDGHEAVDVATCKGANMSFRRVALLAAGPADEGYRGTAFLEDADWSTRVRKLGWRLRFLPDAAVVHLSAMTGGCRVEDAQRTSWWRFHNTGYFVRRHRPWQAPTVAATFAGIALKRAWQWRSPGAVPRLLGALAEGWAAGQSTIKT